MSIAIEPSIHPGAVIGHVHLKVTDLERAVTFYHDVLGFDVMESMPDAAFLSAGGYHHHIGLNTWKSKNGPKADDRAPGLYHLAILYPTRVELARAYARVLKHGVPIRLLEDHGVSEAVYFADPDGNGIEIYHDRPRSEWPRDVNGDLAMVSIDIDPASLLAELETVPAS